MPKQTRYRTRLSASLTFQLAGHNESKSECEDIPQLPKPPASLSVTDVADTLETLTLVSGSGEQDVKPGEPGTKTKHFARKRQTTIPVMFEKFTTHKYIPTTIEIITFPITIAPLQLRDAIIDGMAVAEPSGLVYALTGVNGPSSRKPFTTLIDVSNALEEVIQHIRRSRGKVKGLKVTNQTPVPKAENVVASTQKSMGKANLTQAQHTVTEIESDFIEELQTGKHIRLSYPDMLFWAKEHTLHPTTVTIERPPKCHDFNYHLVGAPLTSWMGSLHAGASLYAGDDTHKLVDSSSDPTGLKNNSSGCVETLPSTSSVQWNEPKSASVSSTRLPSPCELLSSPIESLFADLDRGHPEYSFASLSKRFHFYGIRFVNDITERSVAWFVDGLGMPSDAASLVHGTACNRGKTKIEKQSQINSK